MNLFKNYDKYGKGVPILRVKTGNHIVCDKVEE